MIYYIIEHQTKGILQLSGEWSHTKKRNDPENLRSYSEEEADDTLGDFVSATDQEGCSILRSPDLDTDEYEWEVVA